MRRARASAVLSLSALFVRAGCGGTPSSPDPATAVATLSWLVTDAFCRLEMRCCSALERIWMAHGATLDGCTSSVVREIITNQFAGGVLPSLEAGRIKIDWTRVPACIDSYASMVCSAPGLEDPAVLSPMVETFAKLCPDVFVGQAVLGQPCDLPADCRRGSACWFPVAGGIVPNQWITRPSDTSGSCIEAAPEDPPRPLPREGEPCRNPTLVPRCDPDPALDLSCIGDRVFGGGTCMRRAAPGAACGAAALPYCAAGAYCRPTQSDGIGVCEALGELGDSCAEDTCGRETVCDVAAGVCATPGAVPPGATCATHADCQTRACSGSRCEFRSLRATCSGGVTDFGTVDAQL